MEQEKNQDNRNARSRLPSSRDAGSPDQIEIELGTGATKLNLEEDYELQKLSTQLSSTINDGPFHETRYQKRKQDLSYQAQFHMDIFLEFFMYYALFYIVLGPSIVLFFWKNRILFDNITLFSWHIICFYQYLLWIGTLSGTLLYIFTTNIVSGVELGLIWFAALMRCIIVGTQYATMPVDRINKYRKEKVTDQDRQFDTIVLDWANQTRNIQIVEFVRAAKRHDFDTKNFYIQFFVPPMDDTWEQLKQIKIDHESENESNVSAYKVLCYFIDDYQKKNKYNTQLYSMFNTLVILIPTKLVRIHQIPLGPFEITMTILLFLFSIWALNCTFKHIRVNLDDMTRKLFLLEQCQYLIGTRRIKCNELKLTPSINFHDLNSIESWSMMKSIIFDYGTSYYLRSQIQFTVLAIVFIFILVCGLQMILGYFYLDWQVIIPLSIFGFVFAVYLTLYLYKCSEINGFFETFNTQLENLQFIYLDIKRRKEYYFKEKNVPQNFIHKKFSEYLFDNYGNSFDQISQAIDQAIESLDDCIRANQYDSRNFPLKLLGITITMDMLQNLVMGLFTVVSFVIQQRLSSSS